MVDLLGPSERSARMALIRSRDTSPEVALRRQLHSLGMRYRLNVARLPGKPDLVFPRHKVVVLVHGCFWHHHEGCKVATIPKTNVEFWLSKFDRNVKRDSHVSRELKHLGWRVLIAWECELQTKAKARSTAEWILREIRSEEVTPNQ